MTSTDDRTATDFEQALSEQAHRYSGALGIGPAEDAVEVDHNKCVVNCRDPRRKRRHLGCPSCYGKVIIRDIYSNEIEPAGTRFMWLTGAFLAGWAHAWRQATVGMVRDGLPGDVPPRDGCDGRPRAPERIGMILEDDRAEHQIRLVNRENHLGVSCVCRLRANRPPFATWSILPLAEAWWIYREHVQEAENR